ncbi:MAG: hypothetical protein JWR23_164 [Mucilaginibacter sp.]|nr:hypothetical protein [Mucilaginibacter sp.]
MIMVFKLLKGTCILKHRKNHKSICPTLSRVYSGVPGTVHLYQSNNLPQFGIINIK